MSVACRRRAGWFRHLGALLGSKIGLGVEVSGAVQLGPPFFMVPVRVLVASRGRARWMRCATRPGVEGDGQGPEVPVYYATQLAAARRPTSGRHRIWLGLDYAAQGALRRLAPKPHQPYARATSRTGCSRTRNYMVPYYVSKTLLFWNKTRFKEAGLDKPPASFDEVLVAADKIKGGVKTRPADAQLRLAVLAPVADEWRRSASRPTSRPRPSTRPRRRRCVTKAGGGDQERRRRSDLVDRPLGRAQRGVRHRQCRHAARPCAGLLLDQGQGAVDQRRHAGSGADAGQLGDAQQPRARHLQGLEEPRSRLGFREVPDRRRGGERVSPRSRACSPAPRRSTRRAWRASRRTIRSAFQVLSTQLEHTDKMCGDWRLGSDSRVKDGFWPGVPERHAGPQGRQDRAGRRRARG